MAKEPRTRIHISIPNHQILWLQQRYPKLGYSHVFRVLLSDHIKRAKRVTARTHDLDLEPQDGEDNG